MKEEKEKTEGINTDGFGIYEKLIVVQTLLKAPKNQWNEFSKFHYRNCEDILEALKPLLLNHKLTLTLSDSIVYLGDRFFVKATAKLIDVETEESIEVEAYAREEASLKGMSSAQVTGATSSYARKYALNGMFCIDDTRDPDNLPPQQNTPPATKAPAKAPAKATKAPANTPVQQKPSKPILTIQGVKDWNIMLNMFYTAEVDTRAEGKTFSLKNYIDSIRQCDDATFQEITKRYIDFKNINGFK
ncbi:MAG: ERF family protein [Lachnospiraceae bacterium]|nr:ERF family protein [Lachnospiraceae bacterium]